MLNLDQTIQTAHEDLINDAQFNFFGDTLATCSSDHYINIYEIKNNTQKFKATLKSHEGPVWQISWSHPMYGNLLASCSYDKKVIIWEEIDDKWVSIYVYNNHKSSVNSVQWAPYTFGLKLACASSDGSISILTALSDDHKNWQICNIEDAHEMGCNTVCWSPSLYDTSILDSNPDNKLESYCLLASGGCDNYVKIWREENDKWGHFCTLDGHEDWVRDVAWAPSIALKEQTLASCSQDKKVIIWKTDEPLDKTAWKSHVLYTFDDVVWHVSWSLTGSMLSVSTGDNKISIWKEDLNGHWVCITETNQEYNQKE